MPSLRKIAANQANAAKSTGPKTPEGKRHSSRNAPNHRLCSKIVFERESQPRLNTFLRSHFEKYLPTTPTDHGLVETMAIARWPLASAVTMDTAAINPASNPPKTAEQKAKTARKNCRCHTDPIFQTKHRTYQNPRSHLATPRTQKMAPFNPIIGSGAASAARPCEAPAKIPATWYGPALPKSVPSNQMSSPRRTLSATDLAKIAALDTCTASNAIERLHVRPRNEGFVTGPVTCRFPYLPPMLGYAATARIRTSDPPLDGKRCYYDRMDWWTYVTSIPGPRVMVLEDMDHHPGFGAFVGEIHAIIGHALNCIGCVTNGAVRDLPAVEGLAFQLFSHNVAVSHSYAHIVEFGQPVEIGGAPVRSGDLIHGDRHGVHTIPLEIAAAVPAEAARLLAEESELISYCSSPRFSLDGLSRRLSRSAEVGGLSLEAR